MQKQANEDRNGPSMKTKKADKKENKKAFIEAQKVKKATKVN